MVGIGEFIVFRLKRAADPDLIATVWEEFETATASWVIREPDEEPREATTAEKIVNLDAGVRVLLENPATPLELLHFLALLPQYSYVPFSGEATGGLGYTRTLLLLNDVEAMEEVLRESLQLPSDFFVVPLPTEQLRAYVRDLLCCGDG